MIVIPKNARESTVVRLREHNARRYVDVRLHFHDESGQLCPTKKGITIAPDKAAALADAIRKVALEGVDE